MIRSTNIFLLLFSFLLAQSDMELGITAYNKRAEGCAGAIAQIGPICEAIDHFERAVKSPEILKSPSIVISALSAWLENTEKTQK